MNIENVTKYEKARLIGARALQIAMGAPILLKMKKKDFEEVKFSPINIATKEFEKGILPLSIKERAPRKSAK
jgi:DNA-directed RNA polymerase subunit K